MPNVVETVNRTPVIRNPVTRENLVMLINKGRANEFQQKMFYRSLKPIIYKHLKSVYLPEQEKDELRDAIYAHLTGVLSAYSPKRGKFITWSWLVIRNFSISWSQNECKRRESEVSFSQFVGDDEQGEKSFENIIEDKNTQDTADGLSIELRSIIREIMVEYPSKQKIIMALLGDPDGELNEIINFSQAAKTCGVSFEWVSSFYNDVIYPTIKKLFS